MPRLRLALLLCLAFTTTARVAGDQAPGLGRPTAPFEPFEQSIADLQRALAAGEVTSRQLVEAYLARIAAYDAHGPALNAITVLNPRARDAADALDAERRAGKVRGPLHGVPVLVKDNYETVEMPTSAGSIALADFHPPRDASQVRRLKDAGAIILGKTNMHELAAGITTVGSRFGQTRNPYDLDRNPGGSSGGTGAAIAASFAAAGMGSDTCGSIRNPASHNNLVGLRGTQGLSSRAGIVPLSSTQDIGGPLARSIADLALMLDATVGPDPADAQTAVAAGRIPPSYRAALDAAALKGARLGVVRSLFGGAPEDQEVTRVVDEAVAAMKVAGAEIVEVAIPGVDDLLRDSSMIAADFKFDLQDYLAAAPSPPVTSLGDVLDRGLYHAALESTFRARNAVERRDTDAARRARVKQAALRHVLLAVLDEHRLSALVYPTLRRKPARIGDAQAGSNCQVSAHSGLPALGVPAGFTEDGLPVGLDLLGAAFTEATLLSLGYALEQARTPRQPPFSTPPLVDGRAPAPRRLVVPLTDREGPALELRYDETTARLDFSLTGPDQARPTAVWIHSGTADRPAAARHLLLGGGPVRAGHVTLTAADRRDLAADRLLLRIYHADRHGRPRDVPVRFAPRPPDAR